MSVGAVKASEDLSDSCAHTTYGGRLGLSDQSLSRDVEQRFGVEIEQLWEDEAGSDYCLAEEGRSGEMAMSIEAAEKG